MESRSGDDNNLISEEVVDEVDAPLIKMEDEFDDIVPPKSE